MSKWWGGAQPLPLKYNLVNISYWLYILYRVGAKRNILCAVTARILSSTEVLESETIEYIYLPKIKPKSVGTYRHRRTRDN